MRIKLAYSPCPNDTFAFHAMVHGLVDCEGLSFEPVLADVQELNSAAQQEQYHMCKLSYHAYFLLLDKYVMLRSGSAMGFGNGPLFVAKKGSAAFNSKREPNLEEILSTTILTPGEHTTASLLLKIAFPKATKTRPIIFSNIEEQLVKGQALSGVLIHESRFTYHKKGLQLITDLGLEWQKRSNLPIPLGGIAISRKLQSKVALKLQRVLKRSILYAQENPFASKGYVCKYAQEMESNVLEQHIKMFVNQFTIEVPQIGVEATVALLAETKKIYPQIDDSLPLFI